jgi:hypothetical protein
MMQGKSMHPAMRPGMVQGRGNGMVGNARGGGMMAYHVTGRNGFHGSKGSMEAGFHIAPAGIWWRSPMVVQRLSLSGDQTKKMDSIFEQSRLQLIDLKANVEKQNAMLEPLLSANPPDTTKAMAQIDKVAEARAELERPTPRCCWVSAACLRRTSGPNCISPVGLVDAVDRARTRQPRRSRLQQQRAASGVPGGPGAPFSCRGKLLQLCGPATILFDAALCARLHPT